MAERLPIDGHVVAYWGFDESNETDQALDESGHDRHLTVSNSPAAVDARVGNGRQFNGSTTVADIADSTPFLLASNLTVIVWAKLDQYNSSGSFQRTIVSCEGVGAGSSNNALFRMTVDKDGKFVFVHMLNNQETVTWTTAAGIFKGGKFVSVALVRRDVGGGGCFVDLFLDGLPVSWASAVYSADPLTDYRAIPAPLPNEGGLATLRFGRSGLLSDSAPWYGVIDEASIHDSARPLQPYLRAAFYRVALAASLNRLTVLNSVQSVGSTELATGSRWWAYERDTNIFVIREQPLGFFLPEVQITSGYNSNSAGTTKPKLAYDPGTDTLLVAFLQSGKVYKITGGYSDIPITQYSQITPDLSNILKPDPIYDVHRPGMGASGNSRSFDNKLETYVKTPGQFLITFYPEPFGIVLPAATNVIGYEVYQWVGGQEVLLGSTTSFSVIQGLTGQYFFPIPSRVYGGTYLARPILRGGKAPSWSFSNFLIDYLGTVGDYWIYQEGKLFAGKSGDIADVLTPGMGSQSEAYPWMHRLVFVNKTPLKVLISDSDPVTVGFGSQSENFPWMHRVVFVSKAPIKTLLSDSDPVTVGMGMEGYPTVILRSGIRIM